MSLTRLLTAACAALILASCGGTGRVDARYPTVAEMDRLDAQWGLAPRLSRGAPKRTYRYSDGASGISSSTPSSVPAASAPARETVDTPPPATPAPQLDPATVNQLR